MAAVRSGKLGKNDLDEIYREYGLIVATFCKFFEFSFIGWERYDK